ncbi:acyltransferase [Plectonema radiosum NIES-515]|uniref:Acyltransferase n=1 Tax=Plectonema radiosum NIES-515 TaxID=2986073 RepID=A0ABT3AUA5_9CYAN|nr:acyltransferase [Plectonema radiosum]MCV3212690.1 acyltransferase [Plectonema radiosum NIES-515]
MQKVIKHQKLNLLQVFRGLAAIMVILAHCDLIFNQNLQKDFFGKIFNFGGSGVDFFFVLSGFIILYIHQSDIGNRSKLKSFFIKRFTRIYPIYWVVLTLKLSASLFFAYDADTGKRNILEILKAFILFPQSREILSSSFLGVSWTLTFEIFFYIIFGLLIGLKPKLSFSIVSIWLLLTFTHFIGIFNLPKDGLMLNFIFNEHNLEFFLGCVAAYIVSKHKIPQEMTLICLGAFLYTLGAINYYYKVVEISPVISFGIPSMLLVVGSTSLEMRKHVHVNEVLIYIGNASYSIYLMHGFAINNITKFILKVAPGITQNSLILNILGIMIGGMGLIFGCAVYSYIEKPLISTLKPKLVTT